MKPVRTLAFIHIQKCSGTSFENYLNEYFRPNITTRCFTSVDPLGELETLEEYCLRNSQSPFVYGHVPFRLFEQYFPHALYFTFLRDPVKRTISHYNSWHNPENFLATDPHYMAASEEGRTAIEWCHSASLEEFVNTRNRYIQASTQGNLQTMMMSSLAETSLGEHLLSAKSNLERCAFFGLTDQFSESIDLFRQIFPDAPEYLLQKAHENRSRPNTQPPSEEIVATIKEQCSYDLELYEFAKSIFKQRISRKPKTTYSLKTLTENKTNSIASTERSETGGTMLLQKIEELETQNKALRQHIEQLSTLYNEIVNSRGWRTLERIQRLMFWQ